MLLVGIRSSTILGPCFDESCETNLEHKVTIAFDRINLVVH